MTDAEPELHAGTAPDHVLVYGIDHSPWVQAVLLGLHEKQIAHTLVTLPPLSVFLRTGILMPAVKIGDDPWLLDSEKILVALGFAPVEPEVRRPMLRTFLTGAMRRCDDPWDFWHRFSWVRDGHPSIARRLWNQFFRAFSTFYFFVVIVMGRRSRPNRSREQLRAEFSIHQDALETGHDYLGGTTPATADLQLFGQVQMYASIPGPSLDVLQTDPELARLRAWVERMQQRFRDYDHLYTANAFAPGGSAVAPAPPLERMFFWLGASLTWIAFPVSLLLVLFFARRVRRLSASPVETKPS